MPASAPSLRIAMHQLDLAWNLPDVNLASMERAWKSAPGADVHVFPEMVATGFLTGADELARVEAQADGSPYTAQWKTWAAQSDAVILASLVVRLPDADFRFANRLFAVFPDGQVQTADKMHLFGLAGEDAHFVAGNHPLRFTWKGWKAVAAVCYDLRFPESARNSWDTLGQSADYDVLLYLANWPDRRIAHWDALLPARAIENQAVVVGVNRVGADGQGVVHSGHSGAWDAMGLPLIAVPRGEAATAVVEVRKEDLDAVRRRLPFLQDVRAL